MMSCYMEQEGNRMNQEEKAKEKSCMRCKHFIFKLMMNGYHGHCDVDGNPLFVRFKDSCERYEGREASNE